MESPVSQEAGDLLVLVEVGARWTGNFLAMSPTPSLRYETISFLSDYGTADEFVGVVKAVIRSVSPAAGVIDITHDIAPHDVRAGGLALARSAQFLNPGVVLAVVDPGVGTQRRHVAIEVGDGASVLVGPDNGLFASAVALVGGATAAVELSDRQYHLALEGVSLDAGRDVYGPVAAHLCNGVPLAELGMEIDPALLVPGVLPVSEFEGDTLVAEVLWIDRFGNAQLNIGVEDLEQIGDHFRVEAGGASRAVSRTTTFEGTAQDAVGLIIDSYGLFALVLQRGSAAQELGLHPGDAVRLSSAIGQTGQVSPVTLTSRPSEED